MKNWIVSIVSDLHSGSTVGLCPPRFTLDDGGDYVASKPQRWLWRNWKDWWKTMSELKESTGLPLVAIVNGDSHDGDHHDTTQIITRNEVDQLRIAVAVVEPMLEVADKVIIVRGSAAHVGEGAWREEKLAEDIGAEPHPDGTASWPHVYAEWGNVCFDIQHHPESGDMRSWTSGNGCNRISAEILNEYASTHDRIPDIVIRSHKHRFKTSGEHRYPFVIQTPSWQFPTNYVKGPIAAAGKLPHFGGAYFVCRQGDYIKDWINYKPPRGKPHRMEL